MVRYLRFYFEGAYNAAIGPVSGWMAYHSVVLAAWFGNVDLTQIDSIAKLIGIKSFLCGGISLLNKRGV